MLTVACRPPLTALLDRWWDACRIAGQKLPVPHNREWFKLTSQVLKYAQLFLNHLTATSTERRQYRDWCKYALSKTSWELMLLSIYAYIPESDLKQLESMQRELELSIEKQK